MKNKTLAFNVSLNGKNIDTVFYSSMHSDTIVEACERVRKSLIDHDGYDPEIKITWPKGQRCTENVYEVQGYYQGWECVCAETSRKEARARLKEYKENEGGSYRIVLKRERI